MSHKYTMYIMYKEITSATENLKIQKVCVPVSPLLLSTSLHLLWPLSSVAHCDVLPLLTLSSCESGCSRLCCWMAIGGGRGTESAPSSPSSSPQLCMPEELDLDNVPLDKPSLRTLCNTHGRQSRGYNHFDRSAKKGGREGLCIHPPPPQSHPEV